MPGVPTARWHQPTLVGNMLPTLLPTSCRRRSKHEHLTSCDRNCNHMLAASGGAGSGAPILLNLEYWRLLACERTRCNETAHQHLLVTRSPRRINKDGLPHVWTPCWSIFQLACASGSKATFRYILDSTCAETHANSTALSQVGLLGRCARQLDEVQQTNAQLIEPLGDSPHCQKTPRR